MYIFQELWEALLTKNRLARAQKEHIGAAGPGSEGRWGFFADL